MTDKEILFKLEEIFDLDESVLSQDTELANLVEFDSMAKLSLIVIADEDFNKRLTAEQINDFELVKDIVNFLKS